jgi:hypothetical protein
MTDRHLVLLCRRGIGARGARVRLGDGAKQLLVSMAYPSGFCKQALDLSEVSATEIGELADTVRVEAQMASCGHFPVYRTGGGVLTYQGTQYKRRATAATFGGLLTG